MIPFKIVVTTEDFATMFDTSIDAAREHMTNIRRKFNKPPRAKVTASNVADYTHADRNEILRALNRELW